MERLRSKLNTQIYAEASAWFVACRAEDLDDAGRREFDRWLRKSPEHLSAYLEIAAIWHEGSTLDPIRKWDAATLIAEARQDPGNVVSLAEVSPDEWAEPSAPTNELRRSTPTDSASISLTGTPAPISGRPLPRARTSVL